MDVRGLSKYCRAKEEIPFHVAYMIACNIKQNDVRTAPQGHRFSQSPTLKMVSLILVDEIPWAVTAYKLKQKYSSQTKIFLQFYYWINENIVEQNKEIPSYFAHMITYKIKQNDVRTAPQGHRFSQSPTLKMVSPNFIR